MSVVIQEQNRERIAYNIGWDAGVYGIELYDEWPVDFVTGWAEARRQNPHPKKHDKFIRKWIQLRAGAYSRGKPFSDGVTPKYLKMINQGICPVTFDTLTYARNCDQDWSIDRVDNDRGYERGNLIILSRRVNAAKSALSYPEIQRCFDSNRAVPGLTKGETIMLWGVVSPYFHCNNSDHLPLDNYYFGQAIVPDTPLNWIMSTQILLSISVQTGTTDYFRALVRAMAKRASCKRQFNKMLARLCKYQIRKSSLPVMRYQEWGNVMNCKHLRRLLKRLKPEDRQVIQKASEEIMSAITKATLEENLERWAVG